MEFNEVIQFIKDPDTSFEVDRDFLRLPWDLTAIDYIRFAQQDIEGADKRSTVNALSNAKRAMECQLDSLMLAFGLESVARKWNVPEKLGVLRRLGVIAPRILEKINQHRNRLEHEYFCPAHEVVNDFVDVVHLFIDATKVHINDRRCAWEFSDDGCVHICRVELGNNLICVTFPRRSSTRLEFPVGGDEYWQILGTIGHTTDWQI
jgi:hypothetical protein